MQDLSSNVNQDDQELLFCSAFLLKNLLNLFCCSCERGVSTALFAGIHAVDCMDIEEPYPWSYYYTQFQSL